MRHVAAGRQLLTYAQKLNASGLNQGTSGNLSVRVPGGMLITPTGMAYDELGLEEVEAPSNQVARARPSW